MSANPSTRPGSRFTPAVDPNITLVAYSEHWLALARAHLKPSTLETYSEALRLHLRPPFATTKLRLLQRGAIKAFLAAKLAAGLSRGTVWILYATLRALLNAVIDDEVIAANPGALLGRHFRLVPAVATRQEEIKAMTRQRVRALLAAAALHDGRWHPLWLCLARAGLRLGEGLALEWPDLDFARGEIRVARALSDDETGTPKRGHVRTVDMSRQLAPGLQRLRTDRKAETLRRGWREMPTLVFCSEAATSLQVANVRRAFARTLRPAQLPRHFTSHSLRHTFTSVLQQGESPAYVQNQLGHTAITLTVTPMGGGSRWATRPPWSSTTRAPAKVLANGVAATGYPRTGALASLALSRGTSAFLATTVHADRRDRAARIVGLLGVHGRALW